MAGRTRLFTAALALMFSVAACSSDGEPEAEAELESAESSTTTTVEPTTTTTEAPTTTLSEQAKVEAEVAQLVTDFWLAPFDTSQNEYGAEYLTGLIARRSEEFAESVTASGQIARDLGQTSIEIIRVDVDLAQGQSEVKACTGTNGELVDAETLEQVADPDDPNDLTTTVFFVEQTPEGWKINDMFPSDISSSPERCEIDV